MDERPLTALFVDCDSYFASVEQHLDPSLRGLPVGVAPVLADTSCCIAASYEAKACGVKTGTGLREARALCPDIRIVEARPEEYIRHHHLVVEAVEDCIHVEDVLSVDEMWAWLPLNLREPSEVERIGRSIKASVAERISPALKVSIGAGPNKYLAKIAADMRKPDGLFLIRHGDLPGVLHPLALRDLTGIARNMESRLAAAGIHSVEELCAAPRSVLRAAWGGVQGERMWCLLRGWELPEPETVRRTIGHSHVLPPDQRDPARAWGVLSKLVHKACVRLRAHGMVAGGLVLHLARLRGTGWEGKTTFQETDSTVAVHRRLSRLWDQRPDPRAHLLQVGVVLTRLAGQGSYTPSLFPDDLDAEGGDREKHRRLDAAVDELIARYGRGCVRFASVEDPGAAPMRISFTHVPEPLEYD